MNKDMYTNITRIESTYVNKITSWLPCLSFMDKLCIEPWDNMLAKFNDILAEF